MMGQLGADQRDVLERLLRSQLATLQQSIAAARDGLPRREHARAELEQDPHDLQQLAGDFEVEAGLSDIDSARSDALLDALRRVHTADYGHCTDCKAAIPFERLLLEPQAERCVACETALKSRLAP
jgi:DnaK suppressor protein